MAARLLTLCIAVAVLVPVSTAHGAPAPVTGLTAIPNDAARTSTVTWDADSTAQPGETDALYRRANPQSPLALLETFSYPAPRLRYVDRDLESGHPYAYVVIRSLPAPDGSSSQSQPAIAVLRPYSARRPDANCLAAGLARKCPNPFNQLLPRAPTLDPRSAPKIAQFVADTPDGPADLVVDPNWDTGCDTLQTPPYCSVWHPIFYAQATDPTYTMRCSLSQPHELCIGEGDTIHVPVGAQPAAGGCPVEFHGFPSSCPNGIDAHMSVIQPDGTEYSFWQAEPSSGWSDGVIDVNLGGKTNDGYGSASTAAEFSGQLGIIKAGELQAERINHALFMVIPCGAGKRVYPSLRDTDTVCGSEGDVCREPSSPNEDRLYLGARLQLEPSYANELLASGSLPAWDAAVIRALRDYGAIAGDTGGDCTHFGFAFEDPNTWTSFGLENPFVTYAIDHPSDVLLTGDPPTTTHKYRYVLGDDGIDWSQLRVIDECVSEGRSGCVSGTPCKSGHATRQRGKKKKCRGSGKGKGPCRTKKKRC